MAKDRTTDREDRRPGTANYKIPLRQIVENHNPRYPFSEKMKAAGWTVFDKPPPKQGKRSLWELATSDDATERARYCDILEDLDPQMVSEATTLITVGQLMPIELRDNGNVNKTGKNTYTVIDGMRRVMMALFNWCKTGIPKEPWLEARLSPKINEVGLHHRSIVGNRRKDPTPIEKAKGIQHCLNLGETLGEVASTYGQSESAMTWSLKLLELPIEVQRKIEAGTLTASKALDQHAASNGKARKPRTPNPLPKAARTTLEPLREKVRISKGAEGEVILSAQLTRAEADAILLLIGVAKA